MHEVGETEQVIKEMKKYKIDMLSVSETRQTESGKIRLNSGYFIAYSGNEGENAEHNKGVGIIMTPKAEKSLINWEPISPRIVKAKFRTKYCNLTIVSVYAPTNDAVEEEKNQIL